MKGEIIGKQATVTYAGKTFEGIIIDETKNTIKIETKTKNITIIKKEAKLKINDKLVEGKQITKRPEDRIKAC
jgi:RNase P/RNase MRP subunit p29